MPVLDEDRWLSYFYPETVTPTGARKALCVTYSASETPGG